jgi:hypothetical protein
MANSNGNKGDGDDRGLSAEAERYKQAATDALEMVDWCIGYLVGSRKGGIAAQLAQNPPISASSCYTSRKNRSRQARADRTLSGADLL